MKVDYLIIGGGIAGTTAAEAIRSRDTASSIAVVSDEPHPLYSRILVSKPHFVLGKLAFDNIFLKTLAWYDQQRITLLPRTRVLSINTAQKVVRCHNEMEISYRKLLIAVGGTPKMLTIPGANEEHICYLRTLADAQKFMERIPKATHAVVVGSGFIGFEACDVLRKAGIKTTLVLRKNYFWESLLDRPSCVMIENALEERGT